MTWTRHSSSCDTLEEATCAYSVENGVVRVDAQALIRSRGRVCTDDCGFVRADCDGPPLPSEGRIEGDGFDLDLADLQSCSEVF